jgi:hypothetical protein
MTAEARGCLGWLKRGEGKLADKEHEKRGKKMCMILCLFS